MQRKIHHQRDYDRGDARIKAAVVNAWVIWNIPTPIINIHDFPCFNMPDIFDDHEVYGFNCNGDIVRKY